MAAARKKTPAKRGKPVPPAPAPAPAPTAPAETGGAVARRLSMIRNNPGKTTLALGGLAGLVGGLVRASQTPPDYSNIERAVTEATRRAKSERVAQILERSRMEQAIAQNQARLAQANPTLYTSVMAGRKVPSGAVVLGGRPRTDLMRELAASMDSGAFQKKDPLSELMG
jgi:hypothetical protein